MRLPRGALVNPPAQQFLVFWQQLFVGLGRRHDLVRISREDPLPQQAARRITLGHNRPAFVRWLKKPSFRIKPQPSLARTRIRPMTI